MADDKKKDKGEKPGKGEGGGKPGGDKAKPVLSAEAEKKRAERAEAKAKGGKTKAKTEVDDSAPARVGPARLRVKYEKEIAPALITEFSYKNKMQCPKIVKITVNMGLGEAIQNPKVMDSAVEEMALITGQRPVVTKAKKSIATFKLREGQKIGCMVTLRGDKMFEFLDRLVNMALPRVRDFKGVSPRSFDGRGNFSLGIREQIIFPEVNYDNIDKIKGLNISVVTTARTDDEGRALLRAFGMPFRS